MSCVLPRIDVNRIKMMTPELDETQFSLLVSAVMNSNIEVLGQEASPQPSTSTSPEGNGRLLPFRWPGMKRAGEGLYGGAEKKAKVDSDLIADLLHCSEPTVDFDDYE